MWRVEALNAATNEIRQYKRSYEKKLACNIKNYSKSFYAYIRSKQNIRYKVGPLEDKVGPLEECWKYNITRFFNGGRPKWYFSSVFTRKDIHYQFQILNFRRPLLFLIYINDLYDNITSEFNISDL